MIDDPLDKARVQSAIIAEDADNFLIDLQISGKIYFYGPPEFRYLVWNKEEDQAFGVVSDDDGALTLGFLVPHLGEHRVKQSEILVKAAKAWRDFSRSMEL